MELEEEQDLVSLNDLILLLTQDEIEILLSAFVLDDDTDIERIIVKRVSGQERTFRIKPLV